MFIKDLAETVLAEIECNFVGREAVGRAGLCSHLCQRRMSQSLGSGGLGLGVPTDLVGCDAAERAGESCRLQHHPKVA